jgi:hypothetical protein
MFQCSTNDDTSNSTAWIKADRVTHHRLVHQMYISFFRPRHSCADPSDNSSKCVALFVRVLLLLSFLGVIVTDLFLLCVLKFQKYV